MQRNKKNKIGNDFSWFQQKERNQLNESENNDLKHLKDILIICIKNDNDILFVKTKRKKLLLKN
jgi:hypothetical protein